MIKEGIVIMKLTVCDVFICGALALTFKRPLWNGLEK